MSLKRFDSQIDVLLGASGKGELAGRALVTDVLRFLHEVMYKAARDQAEMLTAVEVLFGSATMQRMAKTIGALPVSRRDRSIGHAAHLQDRVDCICRERGFEPETGRHLFAQVVKALDEVREDEDGNPESPTILLYWGVSREAAYHFGGLYVGDDLNAVETELLGYLDPRLKRFHKLVEIWEMERKWDLEGA